MPDPSARSGRFALEPDHRRGLKFVGAMVALMWLLEIIDTVMGGDLDGGGIRPRAADGLDGIVFAPFLHGGFDHLISNTIPFLILGGMVALSGLARVALVTVIITVIGGVGTWMTGPANTVHIGASGLVFGFAAYLIVRAVYSRRLTHIAGGLFVLAMWGLTLLGGLVPSAGVSWQGHLFGAVGGVVAAWALDGRARRKSALAGAA